MAKGGNLDTEVSKSRGERGRSSLRSFRLLRKFLIGFILIAIVNLLFSLLFYTPKIYSISQENSELVDRYNILRRKISASQIKIDEINHRDKYVYRSLFGLDSVDLAGDTRPAAERFDYLSGDGYYDVICSSWKHVDDFALSLYKQSLSLDELQLLAQGKEALSTAIPAVWPIDRTKLRHGIGGYGMRFHPIYKRYIMHKGIDMAAPVGTPVYATGDAVVEGSVLGYKYSGYGQSLLLDHQYGYKTRYAHLSERLVSVGDTVKRGDIIGLVGSTGGSTGPHLHYEVILQGRTVNPANYFNKNMNSEEYRQLMEQMQDANFELYEPTEGDNDE